MVYTTEGADSLSRGRFWIERDTGRVLMSEMTTQNPRVRGDLDVSSQSKPLLELLIPIEWRFQVSTDQAIGPMQ